MHTWTCTCFERETVGGLVAFIAIAGASILLFVLLKKSRKGVPVSWPVVGMLPALFLHIHELHDWVSRTLGRCGGTFVFVGPSNATSALVSADPANVEYILKDKFHSFPKGPTFRRACGDLLGHGIFNADGEMWTQQRRAAVAEFNSASSLNNAMESLHGLVAARLIPLLDEVSADGGSVDLPDVFTRFTFDNICRIAFGVESGCLSPAWTKLPFAEAIEDASEATVLRFVTPKYVRKIMRRLGVGFDVKLHASLKIVDRFVAEVIQSRREEGQGTGRQDLLSIFMKSKDEKGCPYSEAFLRDVCVNFIIAGRDTTSVALSWFFWLLLRHPDVEAKIVEEIRGIVSSSSSRKQNEAPCFRKEELKEMHYLHACLSETMRLYPPIPIDRKQVNEDVVLPDGTPVKKGTVVFYVMYAIGRMESIWGKDCMEFRPERWLQDGCFVYHSAYKFTVFTAGPRLCLGKDFAYLRMKYVVASILYRFKLKPVTTLRRAKYRLGLSLYMKGGLSVTLHAREPSYTCSKPHV